MREGTCRGIEQVLVDTQRAPRHASHWSWITHFSALLASDASLSASVSRPRHDLCANLRLVFNDSISLCDRSRTHHVILTKALDGIVIVTNRKYHFTQARATHRSQGSKRDGTYLTTRTQRYPQEHTSSSFVYTSSGCRSVTGVCSCSTRRRFECCISRALRSDSRAVQRIL
jgi:hypothetical protein